MLVLKIKPGQSVIVGAAEFRNLSGSTMKIGVAAPKDVAVRRGEVERKVA